MAEPAFDTLSIANELEKDYGFEPRQAQGTATMMHRHLVGSVATKGDIALVRKDVEALDGKIGALDKKIDASVRALDGKIGALEEKITMKMTIRLGGLIIGVFVFFEAFNRVFPIGGGPP